MLRSRSFVATVLAVAMVPVPGLAAPAAPAAAPAAQPASPADAPPPADSVPSDAPPDEVPTSDAPPDEVPVEEPKEEPKAEEPPPETPETVVPEGPERPPEPTLGNGKFKAKGTGLMISGGVLLGAGLVGVITSYFLTRCPEEQIENSFACKNRQHNTFAVPATGAAALLGAVLLIVGLTYRARYKRWENWDPTRAKTAFRPSFTANGVSFKF